MYIRDRYCMFTGMAFMPYFVSGLQTASTTLVIFKMVHVWVPLWYIMRRGKFILYNILNSKHMLWILFFFENINMDYWVPLFIYIHKVIPEKVHFDQQWWLQPLFICLGIVNYIFFNCYAKVCDIDNWQILMSSCLYSHWMTLIM